MGLADENKIQNYRREDERKPKTDNFRFTIWFHAEFHDSILIWRVVIYEVAAYWMVSLSLLLGVLQIPITLTSTDFLNNEDHVDRNNSIMAINIVRTIFKENLYFIYQTLIIVLLNMESPIFRRVS